MTDYTSRQEVLQMAEAISSSLSIFGCILMSIKLSKEQHPDFTSIMLKYLFVVDLILSIFYGIGVAGTFNNGFCQFQGLIIQWFGLISVLWNVLMAYLMRAWIVRKKHPQRLEKTINRSLIMILVLTGILAIILLALGVYSDAVTWCWIGEDYRFARVFCFDIILFSSWIAVIYILLQVYESVQERQRVSAVLVKLGDFMDLNSRIREKLMLYVAVFVLVWFFALLNRLVEVSSGEVNFTTSLLQVIFLPLQGFFNAIIYGGALHRVSGIYISGRKFVARMHSRSFGSSGGGRGSKSGDETEMGNDGNGNEVAAVESITGDVVIAPPAKPEEFLPKSLSVLRRPKDFSIFTTTLNLGEAPLSHVEDTIPDWIVPHHDIYAIGMQECIDIVGVRGKILEHLGGENEYSMYCAEIGSGNTRLGYHGFIALTVYVKMEYIRSGDVSPTQTSSDLTATGADLLVTTAQNKGAVGLPLQIHDTSIAFMTAHLPSDSKGKSKLSKRNASAHRILRETVLSQEDLGYDVHLQHDHVMVFGDLNYRMQYASGGGGVSALTGVAVASLIEKNSLHDDENWMQRKYKLLSYKFPLLPENREELELLKTAKAAAKGAWNSVLRDDELRAIMDDGDAFWGFKEPMPCFPPSYKRKVGDEAGDCGDYTDPLRSIQGYTNTGEIEEEMLFLQQTHHKKSRLRALTVSGSLRIGLAKSASVRRSKQSNAESSGAASGESPSSRPESPNNTGAVAAIADDPGYSYSYSYNSPSSAREVDAQGNVVQHNPFFGSDSNNNNSTSRVATPPNGGANGGGFGRDSGRSSPTGSSIDIHIQQRDSHVSSAGGGNGGLRNSASSQSFQALADILQPPAPLGTPNSTSSSSPVPFGDQHSGVAAVASGRGSGRSGRSGSDPASPQRESFVPLSEEALAQANAHAHASSSSLHSNSSDSAMRESFGAVGAGGGTGVGSKPKRRKAAAVNLSPRRGTGSSRRDSNASLASVAAGSFADIMSGGHSGSGGGSGGGGKMGSMMSPLGLGGERSAKKLDAKKLRRPSYTDRILIHSLPDRLSRLSVQAYDFCDVVRCSDHRPVSMTTVLQVNAAVRNPFYVPPAAAPRASSVRLSNATAVSASTAADTTATTTASFSATSPTAVAEVDGSGDSAAHCTDPSFEVYELVVSNLSARLVTPGMVAGLHLPEEAESDNDDDDDDDDDEDAGAGDSDSEEGEGEGGVVAVGIDRREAEEEEEDGDAPDASHEQRELRKKGGGEFRRSSAEGSEGQDAVGDLPSKLKLTPATGKKQRGSILMSYFGKKEESDSEGSGGEGSPSKRTSSNPMHALFGSASSAGVRAVSAPILDDDIGGGGAGGGVEMRVSDGTQRRTNSTSVTTLSAHSSAFSRTNTDISSRQDSTDVTVSTSNSSNKAGVVVAPASGGHSVGQLNANPAQNPVQAQNAPQPAVRPGGAAAATSVGAAPTEGSGVRKLRAGVKAVIAMNRFRRALATKSTDSVGENDGGEEISGSSSTKSVRFGKDSAQAGRGNSGDASAGAGVVAGFRPKSLSSIFRLDRPRGRTSSGESIGSGGRGRSGSGEEGGGRGGGNGEDDGEVGGGSSPEIRPSVTPMLRESLTWDSSFRAEGSWRQKLIEEEERKRMNRKSNIQTKLKKKIKKKKRSADRMIHKVHIVFPLPCKDPLLPYRKVYELSESFVVKAVTGRQRSTEKQQQQQQQQQQVQMQMQYQTQYQFQQAQHLEQPLIPLRGVSRESAAVDLPMSELLKPQSSFIFRSMRHATAAAAAAAGSSPTKAQKRRSIQDNSRSSGVPIYKVLGCASPELGAHAMLKFTNRRGYELGSCVVSLTHLLNHSPGATFKTDFEHVTLSSGGQVRGEIAGQFSLRYIESPLSSRRGNSGVQEKKNSSNSSSGSDSKTAGQLGRKVTLVDSNTAAGASAGSHSGISSGSVGSSTAKNS